METLHTEVISVGGMTCGGCVASVTKVLAALPGVAKVEVTLEPGQAVVAFDAARVGRADLCAAIDDAGFEAG